jgi:hypothetical protein
MSAIPEKSPKKLQKRKNLTIRFAAWYAERESDLSGT